MLFRRYVAAIFDDLLFGLSYAGLMFTDFFKYEIGSAQLGGILFLPIAVAYFAFKDCLFGNASLGKFLMGLKIVHRFKDEKVSVRNLAMRNLVLLFGPTLILEIRCLKETKTERMGDIWFKTAVVDKKTRTRDNPTPVKNIVQMNILSKRWVAFFIDLAIIAFPFVIAFIIFEAELLLILLFFPFVLMLFKDIFGRSLGKVLMKLKIESTEEGKKLSVWKRIFRNVTLLLGIIEAIVAYMNDGIRLGDLIAKTRVVEQIHPEETRP